MVYIYRISRFIGESSANICESVGNCCWRHFNLVESCSCYPYIANSYETILALFKFDGQMKKSPNNIYHCQINYIYGI